MRLLSREGFRETSLIINVSEDDKIKYGALTVRVDVSSVPVRTVYNVIKGFAQ